MLTCLTSWLAVQIFKFGPGFLGKHHVFETLGRLRLLHCWAGVYGVSVFEVAVADGFLGTETERRAALKNDTVPAGSGCGSGTSSFA